MFEAPQFAVRGQTRYDQNWIDGNTEAGVAGCGWKRPQVRPAELGRAAAPRAPIAKKKPTLRARVKAIVHPAAAEPEQVAPSATSASDPPAATPQPPNDDLLAPPATAPPVRKRSRWCLGLFC